MNKLKLIALIKQLAEPYKEIVVLLWIGDVIINSMELIDNDTNIQLNCWNNEDELEISYTIDDLTNSELQEIVEQLTLVLSDENENDDEDD